MLQEVPRQADATPSLVDEIQRMELFSGQNKSATRLLLELASQEDRRLEAVAELDRMAQQFRSAPLAERLQRAVARCTVLGQRFPKQSPAHERLSPSLAAAAEAGIEVTRVSTSLQKVPYQYKPPDTDGGPVMRRPFEGSPDPLTVGETAVGVGCFLASAIATGMVAEWMAEPDQEAMAIARINCPSVNKQYASAFEVDPASLPWVHVIMGGACCQPFSRIGKRLGWADDRAYTTLRLLHIAATQQNWFAVMENVAEILVAHDGRVWKLIRFVLESEGFHVQAVHTNPCY